MENIKIGELIREVRKEKEMTQKDLAEKLHITDRAVSKWERGLCAPDISLLIPLSEILEVSVLELISGERASTREEKEEVEVKASVEKVISYSEKDISRKTKKLKRKLLALKIVAIILILFIGYYTGHVYSTGDGFTFGCVLIYFDAQKAARALEDYDKEGIEKNIGHSEGLYDELMNLKEQGAVIKDAKVKFHTFYLEDMFPMFKMDFTVICDDVIYKFSCYGTYRKGKIEIMRMILPDSLAEYPGMVYTVGETLCTYYPG